MYLPFLAMAHSLGADAYYLINNGEVWFNIVQRLFNIAYRYWAAKELTLHADVYELPRKNACGIATKLHAIDILGYLFVGFYFKCKLLHFFFVLCLSLDEVPMRFRSASDEVPMEIDGKLLVGIVIYCYSVDDGFDAFAIDFPSFEWHCLTHR